MAGICVSPIADCGARSKSKRESMAVAKKIESPPRGDKGPWALPCGFPFTLTFVQVKPGVRPDEAGWLARLPLMEPCPLRLNDLAIAGFCLVSTSHSMVS